MLSNNSVRSGGLRVRNGQKGIHRLDDVAVRHLCSLQETAKQYGAGEPSELGCGHLHGLTQ